MKSKQSNFFLINDDYPQISRFFEELGSTLFITNSAGEKLIYGYDFVLNPQKTFQLYLTSEKFKNAITLDNLENGQVSIDIAKSYCIEFGLGGFFPYSDRELHRSRLYYNYPYYIDGFLRNKDQDFIDWADGIIRRFKKEFLTKSTEYPTLLLSRKCIDWIKNKNAILSGGGMKFLLDSSPVKR